LVEVEGAQGQGCQIRLERAFQIQDIRSFFKFADVAAACGDTNDDFSVFSADALDDLGVCFPPVGVFAVDVAGMQVDGCDPQLSASQDVGDDFAGVRGACRVISRVGMRPVGVRFTMRSRL